MTPRLAFRLGLAGVLLSFPFILLATCYPDLPTELATLRPMGHWMLFAPKSPFMVFRVPFMNLIHGLIAMILLLHASDFDETQRRHAYSNMFTTLLLAIGVKSTFEGLEMGILGAPDFAAVYGRRLAIGSFASVGVGIPLAIWNGRKVRLPWPELRVRMWARVLIVALSGLYIVVVGASLMASHRNANPKLIRTR